MYQKSIIIFYSQTGNTRKIAYEIYKRTNSDIFEITTDREYSKDMWQAYKEAEDECQTGKLPSLSKEIPDLSNYALIYLGSPVWSEEPANPMKVFLQQVDFQNKCVLPFWTFYDFDGNYIENIKSRCKHAQFLNSLRISNVDIHNKNLSKIIQNAIM